MNHFPKIILPNVAAGWIKAGRARATGLVFHPDRAMTYMAIDDLQSQSTKHYPVGAGDLRGTKAGALAETESGLRAA